MAELKQNPTEIRWDQEAFAAFQATLPPERVVNDEKILQQIFDLAEEVPLLKEALNWAQQHGVKFYVDHELHERIGGYYKQGMGVLCVNAKHLKNPARLVNTIVHEMRHAWQDYHGLLQRSSYGFSEYSIKNSLLEADAYAFGDQAEKQYKAEKLRQQHKRIPDGLKEALRNEKAALRNVFQNFFSADLYLHTYGESGIQMYSRHYKVKLPEAPERPSSSETAKAVPIGTARREFDYTAKALGEGLNVSNAGDIIRSLGKSFSGANNYMSGMQPDFLPKRALCPSLADAFWGAANDEQKRLASGIRKAYLKQKCSPEARAAVRKKWHKWP